MTKSTITRDELNEVIATYGKHHIAHRMAIVLLAAMDSEPVAGEARFKEERPRWTPCTAEHVSMVLANPEDWPNYEVRYLYAAPQPAPVVDADDNFYSWFGREWQENYQHNQYTTAAKQMLGVMAESAWIAATERQRQKQSVSVPDVKINEDVPYEVGRFKTHRDCYCDGWNACRAAMLQSGNSPAQNPGWIPVSERLPEVGGRYWCYVEEQNSLGKSHYQWNCSWNGEIWGGAMMYGRVTHWMPLPAAPQEVKGE